MDGDDVVDRYGDGVSSRAVSGIFENFDLSSLCLNEYSWPILRGIIGEASDSDLDESSLSLCSLS